MYDEFRSVRSARVAYKRCRKQQWFILTGDLQRKCAVCGHRLDDFSGFKEDGSLRHLKGFQGNRNIYSPNTKTVVSTHYTCGWQQTLSNVFNQANFSLI